MKVLVTGGSGKLGRTCFLSFASPAMLSPTLIGNPSMVQADTTIIGDIEDLPAVVRAAEQS